MNPVEPGSTGKSMQFGLEGTEPMTSSSGEQEPTSQSESMMPLQLSSTPLQVSSRSGPAVHPAHVITSSRHWSLSGPSQASPMPKPLSMTPSQSSSSSL